MNRYKKNTAAFIFIITISVPFIFSAFVFLKTLSIQHEMSRKLDAETLQTITIPVTAFIWDLDEKEILVNGKMFDIKSITKENEHYVITGLYDLDQTDLQNKAQCISIKKTTTTQDLSIGLSAFFTFYSFPQYKENAICFSWLPIKLYCTKQKNIPEVHLDISTPPPQQLV